MCLSKVYLDEREEDKLVLEDVSQVTDSRGGVELSTLFSETKRIEGYRVGVVDLTENYVVLKKEDGGEHG